MGKCFLHSSLFIFDRIIIKVAGNQDRHKSSHKFDFMLDQTTHFGVTCPWMTNILHFRTWISLRPVGQSWSNFMCSITGVGERLHKVLGQIGSKLWFPWQQNAPIDLKLLVTRTGIKARTSSISGLWFPWPIYLFFEIRFVLGTLDSGERSLPFGLHVFLLRQWQRCALPCPRKVLFRSVFFVFKHRYWVGYIVAISAEAMFPTVISKFT